MVVPFSCWKRWTDCWRAPKAVRQAGSAGKRRKKATRRVAHAAVRIVAGAFVFEGQASLPAPVMRGDRRRLEARHSSLPKTPCPHPFHCRHPLQERFLCLLRGARPGKGLLPPPPVRGRRPARRKGLPHASGCRRARVPHRCRRAGGRRAVRRRPRECSGRYFRMPTRRQRHRPRDTEVAVARHLRARGLLPTRRRSMPSRCSSSRWRTSMR